VRTGIAQAFRIVNCPMSIAADGFAGKSIFGYSKPA
jgi:hypothetical protein